MVSLQKNVLAESVAVYGYWVLHNW